MGLNRQMRRQHERNQIREWRNKGQIQQAVDMMQNGIQKKHLDAEWDAGHKAGFEKGAEQALKTIYAACVLELLDAGNSKEEAISFVKAVDSRAMLSIDAKEDIEEVFKRTGVRLELKEELDRVQEVRVNG